MNTGPFYIGVADRCAIDMGSLKLPVTEEEAVQILESQGFELLNVNFTALARSLVGFSQYKRHCLAAEAPNYVDCSSFTKWLYGQKGIWLPRHPIDQRNLGFPEVRRTFHDLQEGDLIFKTGRRNLYWSNPEEGIGHVGMITADQTVIHAANPREGVVETPLEEVLVRWSNRGVIRIIPDPKRTFTFLCPPQQPVELSSAFRWKVLSSL